MKTSVWRTVAVRGALAVFGLLAAACGNGSNGGDSGGNPNGGSTDGWGSPVSASYPAPVANAGSCLSFDAPAEKWGWGLYGYWTGEGLAAWMPSSVFPDHAQPSFVVIKFLSEPASWYSAVPDTVAPRTITFGPDAGPEARIDTCTVCPVLVTNVWGDNPTAVWYPVSGTLTLETANVATREFSGTLRNVVWKRVGIYGVASFANWVQSPDPIHPEQPECALLSDARFDSRAVPGRACHSADDCPNQLAQVCDADGASCVASECDQGRRWDDATGDWVTTQSACASGRVCEIALDTDTWYYGTHIEHAYTTGACVKPCDPSAAAPCPAGQVCEATTSVSGQPDAHVCHPAG